MYLAQVLNVERARCNQHTCRRLGITSLTRLADLADLWLSYVVATLIRLALVSLYEQQEWLFLHLETLRLCLLSSMAAKGS